MAGLLDAPVTFGLLSALPAVGQALQPSRFPRNPFGDLLTAAGGFGAGYLGAQQAQDMTRLRQEQLKGLQTRNALNDLTLGYYQNAAQPAVAPPKASPQVFTPAASAVPGTSATPAATPAMPMPSPAPSGYAMSLPTLIGQYQTYSRVPGLQNLAQQTLALIQQQVKGGIGITDTGALAPLPGAVAANAQVAYGKGLGQTVAENNKNQVVSPGAQVFFGPRTLGQAVAGNGVPGQPYTNPNSPALTRITNKLSLPPQEGAEAKTVGTFFGKAYTNLQNATLENPAKRAKLDQLDALLGQVNTGKFAGTTLQLKKAALAAGIDLGTFGVADDTAPAQAAQALSRAMALELRNPQGGAGMPGALSDSDRAFLESMVPGLETTADGRQLMIGFQKRLLEREDKVAQIARNYRKANGHIDEGFFNELADYSAAHPIFSKDDIEKVTGAKQEAPAASAPKILRFDAQGNLIQ